MKAGTAIDATVTEAPTCSRESGIMDIVDRERAEAAVSAAPNGTGRSGVVGEAAMGEGSVNSQSASSESTSSGSMHGAINGSPAGAPASSQGSTPGGRLDPLTLDPWMR